MSLLGGIGKLFGGGGGNSGIGNKQTDSSTTNTSDYDYTDSSANAGGTNSLAIGSGANVNIQNLSESVANTAINAGVTQTAFIANTLKSITESSAKENEATRNSADIALKTNAGLLTQLQSTAGATIERGQNPEATSIKTILQPLIIGAAVIVGLFLLFRKK
jgi:hypothetical protein